MAKRKFSQPLVILSTTPGDDVVIGGGTGQGTIDPYPCSFGEWQKLFEDDYLPDDTIDFNDYVQWWADNGFSLEDWEEYNPGVDFEWE